MAKICSSQKLLGYRCKLLGHRLHVLMNLIGENSPLCSSVEEILNEILELATCQLFLTSRTIHTGPNPYRSTTEFMPNFSVLASVLSTELCSATKVLTTVMTDTHLLENLEILAISLRKLCEQLKRVSVSNILGRLNI